MLGVFGDLKLSDTHKAHITSHLGLVWEADRMAGTGSTVLSAASDVTGASAVLAADVLVCTRASATRDDLQRSPSTLRVFRVWLNADSLSSGQTERCGIRLRQCILALKRTDLVLEHLDLQSVQFSLATKVSLVAIARASCTLGQARGQPVNLQLLGGCTYSICED